MYRHTNYAILLKALVIAIGMSACESDNSLREAENPILQLLSLPNTKIDTVEKAAKVWEYGFRFTPIKEGIIIKFGIKVPSVGTYKVRFYDLGTDSLVLEQAIESKTKHLESYVDINNIRVKPGTEYGLSLIADAFFKVKHIDSTAISFPQTFGNIRILSFNEEACGIIGCSQFPPTTNSIIIAPCVTLIYIGDE